MKAAAEFIQSLSNEQIQRIENGEVLTMQLEGEQFELISEDVEIFSEDIPGWLVANDGNITLALDITITEELLTEGHARELVNRIQNLRKEKNFNVTDRIRVLLERHDDLKSAIATFKDFIQTEVLADSIELSDQLFNDRIQWLDDTEIGVQISLIA